MNSDCAVLHGAKDIKFNSTQVEKPDPDDATVAIKATGLCGSDLHYYLHGRNGDYVLKTPLVLGHESAGIVTAVGDNVKTLSVGDRVAIEPGISCRSCTSCVAGRYNLCSAMRFRSSAKVFPHFDGTLQTTVNHPARLLFKISDSITYEQASLAEPLSVVLHASRRADLRAGQTVLVLGAGPVGLLACLMARACGASKVALADLDARRLEFAKSHSFASHYVEIPRGPRVSGQEALDEAKKNATLAKEAVGLTGFDVVFECTGAEPAIQLAIYAAQSPGKVMIVGMGSTNVFIPLSAAAFREVDIQGVFRYSNTYAAALDLLASSTFTPALNHLITQRFPLKNTVDAFETMVKGSDEAGNLVLKVVVNPDQ